MDISIILHKQKCQSCEIFKQTLLHYISDRYVKVYCTLTEKTSFCIKLDISNSKDKEILQISDSSLLKSKKSTRYYSDIFPKYGALCFNTCHDMIHNKYIQCIKTNMEINDIYDIEDMLIKRKYTTQRTLDHLATHYPRITKYALYILNMQVKYLSNEIAVIQKIKSNFVC